MVGSLVRSAVRQDCDRTDCLRVYTGVVPYGRRSALVRKVCPKLCGRPYTSVVRVSKPEQFGIPEKDWASKPNTHSAYYCAHCGFIWFESEKPKHIVPLGLLKGGEFGLTPGAAIHYVEPKSPTRAASDRALKASSHKRQPK